MADALLTRGVEIKEEMFGPEHGQTTDTLTSARRSVRTRCACMFRERSTTESPRSRSARS